MGEGNDLFDKVFRKKADIVSREIAGETILVPIRDKMADMQRIWSLNPVAGFIWSKLNGKMRLKDIRDEILESFDVEKTDAESDIMEFISELLKSELVEEQTPSEGVVS